MEDSYLKLHDFRQDYFFPFDFLPISDNLDYFIWNLGDSFDPSYFSKICSQILLKAYNCKEGDYFSVRMSQVQYSRMILWLPVFFPLLETNKKLLLLLMFLQYCNIQVRLYLLFHLDKFKLEVSWVKVRCLHRVGVTLIFVISISVDIGGNGWNRLILINIDYIF